MQMLAGGEDHCHLAGIQGALRPPIAWSSGSSIEQRGQPTVAV